MFSHTPIATTTRRRTRLVIGASVCLGIAIATVSIAPASPAYADTVAYLVNVTVRPGYNFPNADAAISYGNEICDKTASTAANTPTMTILVIFSLLLFMLFTPIHFGIRHTKQFIRLSGLQSPCGSAPHLRRTRAPLRYRDGRAGALRR